MSLSQAINSAVKQARQAIGDLVVAATLRKNLGDVYDASEGRYVPNTEDVQVEVAADKFTFAEQQDSDYQSTDVKLIVFNPNNDLEITTDHQMVYLGMVFNVHKSDPSIAGGYRPIWTVTLRK